MKNKLIFALPLILLQHFYFVALSQKNPVELGKIKWLRSFDEALSLSKEKDKDIFILFQEVPGCSTCQSFGNAPLSHPLIVEAIETYFVPLAIHNNKSGKDAEVLKFYQEPAWNNPVVRIVDVNKENVLPRFSGKYQTLDVLNYILFALDKRGIVIPTYLQLLKEELSAEKTEEIVFSMYCFWSGESKLGQIEGIVGTMPGFMNGKEVVKVTYNPDVVSTKSLINEAIKRESIDKIFTGDDIHKNLAIKSLGASKVGNTGPFSTDKQPKYYLSRTSFQYVPMFSLQSSKVNSYIASGKDVFVLLSPRQIAVFEYFEANKSKSHKSVIGEDFEKAWWRLEPDLIR